MRQVGPVIMRYGTEAQKAHYLPRILSGADTWCQGYSEPNAGSDLSNLGLRGVRGRHPMHRCLYLASVRGIADAGRP